MISLYISNIVKKNLTDNQTNQIKISTTIRVKLTNKIKLNIHTGVIGRLHQNLKPKDHLL